MHIALSPLLWVLLIVLVVFAVVRAPGSWLPGDSYGQSTLALVIAIVLLVLLLSGRFG